MKSRTLTSISVRAAVVTLTALLLALVLVYHAGANFPGTNGQIAFVQGDPFGVVPTASVFIANPDGSHQQQVPLGEPIEFFTGVVWSPDGTKLLISHTVRSDSTGQGLFQPATVNLDGSGFNQLSPPNPPGTSSAGMDCGVWSRDQTRLLCGLGDGVFSIRASDGGDPVRLATNPYAAIGGVDSPTDSSPDGTRFIFLRFKPSGGPTATPKPDVQVALFVENLDGTGLRQITPYLLADRASAKWSPDGKEIIVSTRNGIAAMLKGGLFIVYPDGSGLTPINLQVGTQKYSAFSLQWSPDGTRIIFNMFINGGEGIFTANHDGSSVVQVKFTTNFQTFYGGPDWGTHPVTP